MMLSPTRIIGFICTWAMCDVLFPPAKVPSAKFEYGRLLKGHNAHVHVPPIVVLSISSQFSIKKEYSTVKLKGYISETVRGRTFSAFEGIPYARPQIGNLRLRDPVGEIEWSDTFDATKKSAVCIQMDPTRFYNTVGEEDCLYFNIYAPTSKSGKLPVMIWIHGGAFLYGSGNYFGPAYLLDKDVILVTFNYRLGPFGFASTGDYRMPGNFGLKDQALLINWIYHNIEAFGGDNGRITIFGQSAGAASTHFYLMSNKTKDKIYSAISHSGTAFSIWALPPQMPDLTKRFAFNLGCSPNSPDIADCLRKIPAKRLSSSQYDLYKWRENPVILFGPVIEHKHENAFLTDSPEVLYKTGQVANVPFITGVTKDEGNIFSLVLYLGVGARSFLQNLDKTLPACLLYPENDLETSRKIKEFYLSEFEQKLTFSGYETLDSVGKIVGDLYFYSPTVKAAEFHTNWTSSPVYAYFVSHQGRFGISEKFLMPPSQFGVLHLDDTQYLFNATEYFQPLTPADKDYIMVEHMTTLWTNFATNRIPSLHVANLENVTDTELDSSKQMWKKYNLMRRDVLDINLRLSMRRQPYEERTDFWKTTPYF